MASGTLLTALLCFYIIYSISLFQNNSVQALATNPQLTLAKSNQQQEAVDTGPAQHLPSDSLSATDVHLMTDYKCEFLVDGKAFTRTIRWQNIKSAGNYVTNNDAKACKRKTPECEADPSCCYPHNIDAWPIPIGECSYHFVNTYPVLTGQGEELYSGGDPGKFRLFFEKNLHGKTLWCAIATHKGTDASGNRLEGYNECTPIE